MVNSMGIYPYFGLTLAIWSGWVGEKKTDPRINNVKRRLSVLNGVPAVLAGLRHARRPLVRLD